MESAHDPLARISLCAPAGKMARSQKNGPRPTSRENNLRARLGNGPKPKTVHRPARARRVPRSRPQPGPGPGKTHPAWAESRSDVCEPSISIRRSRAVFGRTKPASSPVAQNPSLISVFLRSLSRAAAVTPSDRAAPERARPRRRPSPSPVCALTVG
jgi:hypothetical protein